MPLVTFCGIPGAGKSWLASRLRDHFESLGKEVVLVNDESERLERSVAYLGTCCRVDAIARRFEEPLEKNRWDSPLIRVLPDVDATNVSLVLQHIEQVILHGKVTKAGWATQAKLVVETSFLQQLDAITNAI
ncbi:hypothetical protein DYB38_000408, partial [Aphanomyces astaci]